MLSIIIKNEWRRLFATPLAWLVLAASEFSLAIVFILGLWSIAVDPELLGGSIGVSEVIGRSLFGMAAWVMVLIIPVVAARTISDDRRNGSWPLLLSAPVSATEIVIGKFLPIVGLIALVVTITAAMPLSLLVATDIDVGRIASASLGIFLLATACAALAFYLSSFMRHSGSATIAALSILLALWMLSAVPTVNWMIHVPLSDAAIPLGELVAWCSVIGHYDSFAAGAFSVADTIWYLGFAALFLGLAVLRIDAERR